MRQKVMGILEMATSNRAQCSIIAVAGVRRNISKEQVPAITARLRELKGRVHHPGLRLVRG